MNSTRDPQLWMMNSDGSGRTQISNFSGSSQFVSMAYPLWMKDGSSVLFSAHVTGEKWNIYSYKFEGARLEPNFPVGTVIQEIFPVEAQGQWYVFVFQDEKRGDDSNVKSFRDLVEKTFRHAPKVTKPEAGTTR